MDRYLKVALRGAIVRLANFIASNFIALFGIVCLIGLVVLAGYWSWETRNCTAGFDGKQAGGRLW